MANRRAHVRLLREAVPERIVVHDHIPQAVWSTEVQAQLRRFHETRVAWERVLYAVSMDSTDAEIQEALRAFWSVGETDP
jgi:hypothetical protein